MQTDAKIYQIDQMQQRINDMESQLQSATVMHGQVNDLVLKGILKPDIDGNLDLNADDENFE